MNLQQKKRSRSVNSYKDPDAAIIELAANMPGERAGLLDVAKQSVDALNAAVLASDVGAANVAVDHYEAAAWKLNNGTFFGYKQPSNPEAGGILAENHCRATPGASPMWGQCGEFLIEVSGITAVVEVEDGISRFSTCFIFQAVDPDGPFISETGYRSKFERFDFGRSVEEAAIATFTTILTEGGRKMLLPEARESTMTEHAPWLDASLASVSRSAVFKEPGGQFAFGF
ncbi:hypothetical protein [Paraburkholderia sp. J8-2]|uniref:hypothetical protein n=1 Tax=Paraburkholderia sp. J8-2 TaxID=2805440 RepID=UPI002AB77441|nr:hypothetical protein [Paraburkholderia sp. J8-2]